MKTNYKLVSIIIPTLNRAHLIGETLDSVIAQTYQNWECIIVDDGSFDNTDEIVGAYINKDARFKYYQRPEEHLPGGNGARNYGFKMSQGEYVLWFDSDDLMVPKKLNYLFQCISEDLNVVFSGHSVHSDQGFQVSKQSIFDTNLVLFESLVTGEIKIHTSSSLWKKKFLSDKDLFDENLRKGQELDFYSRIFFKNQLLYAHTGKSTSLIRPQANGIMRTYSKEKKTSHINSFLYVRSNIHKMTHINYDSYVFFKTFAFYEETLVNLIKKKKHMIVVDQIKFLKRYKPQKNRYKYFLKLEKVAFFNFTMKMTIGSGYYFFKRLFKY